MVGAFASGFLLSLSVCLDLGLVNVAMLRTALRRGARAAFWLGLGSCFGDLTYFVLSAFGVTRLLAWTPARWALWLGGTAALLFLAGKMVREALHPHALVLTAPDGGPDASFQRLFLLGLGLALASPSAILWFAAVGGSVIASYGGRRDMLAPFVGGFFAAGVAWSVALSFGAAALGRLGGARVVRILSVVSALLFLYFAYVVFRDGARALL